MARPNRPRPHTYRCACGANHWTYETCPKGKAYPDFTEALSDFLGTLGEVRKKAFDRRAQSWHCVVIRPDGERVEVAWGKP